MSLADAPPTTTGALPGAVTLRQRAGAFLRRVLGGRVVHVVIVLLIVSFGVSLLVEVAPGDPATAILGENATPEQLEVVRERLGLDQSITSRYLDWASGVMRGDLGQSIRTNEPVMDAVIARLPVTIQLAVMAQLMALLVCFPLSVFMARRAGRRVDRLTDQGLAVLIATPTFVLGLVLVYLLGVRWQVFPVAGWVPITQDLRGNLHHAFLPAFVLCLAEIATYTRMLRGDLVATLDEDFVRAARARGIPMRRVMFSHALRPSMFTFVTLSGLSFARLMGGSVIVESIFALPGLGSYIAESVGFGDIPVVQGVTVLIAATFLVTNMLVDASYGWIDPRVRNRGGA